MKDHSGLKDLFRLACLRFEEAASGNTQTPATAEQLSKLISEVVGSANAIGDSFRNIVVLQKTMEDKLKSPQ